MTSSSNFSLPMWSKVSAFTLTVSPLKTSDAHSLIRLALVEGGFSQVRPPTGLPVSDPSDERGDHREGEDYRQVWTRELEREPGVGLGRRKKKLDVCSQEKRVHHRGSREIDEKPGTREEWGQKQADGYEDQSVRHDEPRGPPGTNDRGEHRDADGGVIFLCDYGEAPEVTRSPDEDERAEQPRGARIRKGDPGPAR